jgi:hypothetical protein
MLSSTFADCATAWNLSIICTLITDIEHAAMKIVVYLWRQGLKGKHQVAAEEPAVKEVLQAGESLQPSEPRDIEEISDSSSSSSSGSSDLDADDIPDSRFDDDSIEAIGLEPKVQDAHVAGFEAFQHYKSGTVHYRDLCFSSRFLCNRIYTSVYSKITGQLKYQWPVCSQCIVKTRRP